MSTQEHQGWTNQATFHVALYINNNSAIQGVWLTVALEELTLAASDEHVMDGNADRLDMARTTLGNRLRDTLADVDDEAAATNDAERLGASLILCSLAQVNYWEIAATLIEKAQEQQPAWMRT